MELFKLFGSILIHNDEADKSLQKTDEHAEKVGNTFLSGIGSAAKWSIGIGAAMGAAVGGVVVAGAKMSDELQKSLNGIQAAVGYGDKGMEGIRDTMLNIYNNNFGESFEDIGNAIKTVGQQTNASGKELESLTTNALMLRDTFDFDVSESTRSAKMLMDQFGLSGENSFNLIAQGAQYGLDKNGDLLDSINEYSVQFSQMGFSADEMFNMFNNGAKGGAFSIDKLGDAVKEFSIRTKDGSTSTSQAFTSLGLDAGTLSKNFAQGGEVGKQAFEEVNKKIMEMKDPLAQNQIGVALYGSMWEDLGVKGIAALSNTQGELDSTYDALAKINSVKYNTFGEALEGIKRNLLTGIFLPLGDKVLPVLSQFSTWFIANMPAIKDGVNGAMTTIGNVFTSVANIVTTYLIPAFNSFWAWLQPNMPAIQGFVTSAFEGIKTVLSVLGSFVVTYIIPIFISLKDWFIANFPAIKDAVMQAYNYIKPSFDDLVRVVSEKVIPVIQNLWEKVQTAMPGVQAVFQLVMPVIMFIIKAVIDSIVSFIDTACSIYNVISPVLDMIMNKWVNTWTTMRDVVYGAGDFIGGVISGIKNGFKGMVNGVIGGLNTMIRGLNKLSFTVPDWVPGFGGDSFGFNLGEIPSYAVGTRYLPNDMLIQAHEGEMIVPKSENPYANSTPGDTLPVGNKKQPLLLQFIMPSGKVFAEYTVDDINAIQGTKTNINARGLGLV